VWVRGCVGVWVCGCVCWVCGCVCWVCGCVCGSGLLQFRIHSSASLIHSASLRSFTPLRFAGQFRRLRDTSFFVIVGLSCGYRVVGGGAPVGL